MHPMTKVAAIAAMIACGAARADDAPETAPGVEGVRAVEAHWQRAFLDGDAAYLDTLLDAGYVSVGHAGAPRPKAEIIALSRKIAAQHLAPQPPGHPASIVVRDRAAIVTSSNGGDTSVDVFYYADGRWHAWYSQHTPVVPTR